MPSRLSVTVFGMRRGITTVGLHQLPIRFCFLSLRQCNLLSHQNGKCGDHKPATSLMDLCQQVQGSRKTTKSAAGGIGGCHTYSRVVCNCMNEKAVCVSGLQPLSRNTGFGKYFMVTGAASNSNKYNSYLLILVDPPCYKTTLYSFVKCVSFKWSSKASFSFPWKGNLLPVTQCLLNVTW